MPSSNPKKEAAAVPQPPPVGKGAVVLPRVMADLEARAVMGEQKYGTRLRAHNGRDALIDAYQEALDLVMYLKQAIMERGEEKVLNATNEFECAGICHDCEKYIPATEKTPQGLCDWQRPPVPAVTKLRNGVATLGAEVSLYREENAKMRDLLSECADEIESEVKSRWGWPDVHPAQRRKFDRDIEIVVRIRKLL